MSWIKVDGQLVYKAEPKASEEMTCDETPAVSDESVTQDVTAAEVAASDVEDADTPVPTESF